MKKWLWAIIFGVILFLIIMLIIVFGHSNKKVYSVDNNLLNVKIIAHNFTSFNKEEGITSNGSQLYKLMLVLYIENVGNSPINQRFYFVGEPIFTNGPTFNQTFLFGYTGAVHGEIVKMPMSVDYIEGLKSINLWIEPRKEYLVPDLSLKNATLVTIDVPDFANLKVINLTTSS